MIIWRTDNLLTFTDTTYMQNVHYAKYSSFMCGGKLKILIKVTHLHIIVLIYALKIH